MSRNVLYQGDNLKVLREEVKTETVDLIYLDPPFNSQANYNILFKDHEGTSNHAQAFAFQDTWVWGEESEQAIQDLTMLHGPLAEYLQQTVSRLGNNGMSAYLVMMALRLVELHRVLKPTGSLYLHCDPTASHYLKTILDVIFGPDRMLSEIIWKRTSAHNSAKRFGPVHDTILLYSKTRTYTWNTQYLPYDQEYLDEFYVHRDADGRRWRRSDLTGAGTRNGATGQIWRGIDVTAKGRHWAVPPTELDELDAAGKIHWPAKTGGVPQLKRYADEQKGVPASDIWTDIKPLHNLAQERLGYPTQKPVALLERILLASSQPGDLVLDPFCGCGTTIAAAQKLGRAWVGIDITHLSVQLIKDRLKRDHGMFAKSDYLEVFLPVDADTARNLAENNPFQFQFWIVTELGGTPYGALGDSKQGKKGADKGVDGNLYFRTPTGGKVERVVLSVKAGRNLNPAMVRELRGTVEREKAAMGVLLLAHEPSKGMQQEAREAGSYVWEGRTFPKLQIITAEQVANGVRPVMPAGSSNVSFERKAVKTLSGRGGKDKGADPLLGN